MTDWASDECKQEDHTACKYAGPKEGVCDCTCSCHDKQALRLFFQTHNVGTPVPIDDLYYYLRSTLGRTRNWRDGQFHEALLDNVPPAALIDIKKYGRPALFEAATKRQIEASGGRGKCMNFDLLLHSIRSMFGDIDKEMELEIIGCIVGNVGWRTLSEIKDRRAIPALLGYLHSHDAGVGSYSDSRKAVLVAIGNIGDKGVVPELVKMQNECLWKDDRNNISDTLHKLGDAAGDWVWDRDTRPMYNVVNSQLSMDAFKRPRSTNVDSRVNSSAASSSSDKSKWIGSGSIPNGPRETAEHINGMSADSMLCQEYLSGHNGIKIVQELGKLRNSNAQRLLAEIEKSHKIYSKGIRSAARRVLDEQNRESTEHTVVRKVSEVPEQSKNPNANEENERVRADEQAKVQTIRKSSGKCVMCGRNLGFLSRIFGNHQHAECKVFKE